MPNGEEYMKLCIAPVIIEKDIESSRRVVQAIAFGIAVLSEVAEFTDFLIILQPHYRILTLSIV